MYAKIFINFCMFLCTISLCIISLLMVLEVKTLGDSNAQIAILDTNNVRISALDDKRIALANERIELMNRFQIRMNSYSTKTVYHQMVITGEVQLEMQRLISEQNDIQLEMLYLEHLTSPINLLHRFVSVALPFNIR